MGDYIDRTQLLECKEWSYDLKAYVVPVKAIMLAQVHDLPNAPEGNLNDVQKDDMLKFLCNRCFALVGGAMCTFCGIRKSCDEYRSIGRSEEKT